MFKTKELELKIKDLYYSVNLLKEEIEELRKELKAEKDITPEEEKRDKIEKSFQNLFNYTERIATRGYDN